MRKVISALLLVVAVVGLNACSTLSLRIRQFRGDLSRSYRTRLAEARGKANLVPKLIRQSSTVTKYFDGFPKGRTPTAYLDRINGFMDRLEKLRGGNDITVPDTAGLPRPGEPVLPPAGEAAASVRTPQGETRIEARGDEASASVDVDPTKGTAVAAHAKSSSTPTSITGAPRAVVDRALSALEKELQEFGSLLAEVSADDMRLSDKETRGQVADVVDRLNTIGRQIRAHIEFADFGELARPKNDEDWETINPIETFGGLGTSEFVVFRDDAGNYQLKSAIFDPGDVVQAAGATAAGVLSTFARLHGVPLGAPSEEGAKEGVVSGQLLEAETKALEARADQLEEYDQQLVAALDEVRTHNLMKDGKPADTVQGALPNEKPADTTKRVVERLRQLLSTYRKRVEPLLKKDE